jgi:hypothetical protein
MDVALGIKAEDLRIFTVAMLFSSTKNSEIVLYIGRIFTTDRLYKSHVCRLYKIDPVLTLGFGMYSLKLEDRDGDYLAIHCHEYAKAGSRFYFVETSKINQDNQDIVCVNFAKGKQVIEYQWVSLAKKFLVCITRDLEIFTLDPQGNQILLYFKLQARVGVPLPFYLTKKVTDISTIQFFNVNTEGHLVLFVDKNVMSLDFSNCQDVASEGKAIHINC